MHPRSPPYKVRRVQDGTKDIQAHSSEYGGHGKPQQQTDAHQANWNESDPDSDEELRT
jgi:hypothetical protein